MSDFASIASSNIASSTMSSLPAGGEPVSQPAQKEGAAKENVTSISDARPLDRNSFLAGRVLVIDVGGTHVKAQAGDPSKSTAVLATDSEAAAASALVKIPSGPNMTAAKMAAAVRNAFPEWNFAGISVGYPGPVIHNRPLHEPANLGAGWVGFNFENALGCQVKIVNDAAMQALGSYHGGRMLFLGLGTGLGSAMIVDGLLEPLELAHLPYKKGRTYEDYVGVRGMERMGKKKWRKEVENVIALLKGALEPEYVVLGGGNTKFLKELPQGVELGANENAIAGGLRLWTGAVAAC